MSCERLENDPSLPQRTTLSVDEIYSLLNLCQEATYLMFDGQVYQQVHGMAIGSPVSVVVAKNGYPATFVQRLRLPQTDQDERHTARTSVTIPYIRGLSQSIRRVLSYLDIRVAFRPFWTLRQELVHPKDPVPELRRKGVVYAIPCDQCPRCYVGQTGRSLEQRLGEHHRALGKGDVLASTVTELVFTTRWTCYGFAPSHPDLVSIGVLAH